jgi:hypothetical protein
MNLPPYDPAQDCPLPIDRSVFLCRRNRRLDNATLLGYWDGGAETPKLAGRNAGSS